MTDWSTLGQALQRQKAFSDIFFDVESMTPAEKREMLKTFILSLHAETTGIVESVNYKEHRLEPETFDMQKLLYKSVDTYRYILAILNLFDITETEFSMALAEKDDFLHYRHELLKKSWSGQPVAVFDMDDVIAKFRQSFCAWSTRKCGNFIDPESEEYYNTREFKKLGIKGEAYFKEFVDSHGFLSLDRDETYCELLNHLKDQGYWIQILTSRPASNLTCFYDTYSWLARNGIRADGVAFSAEKFSWLSTQQYFNEGRYFAVDDSAKHAAEYAKHYVNVLVPEKSYNQEVRNVKYVSYVPRDKDPRDFIPKI